MDMETIRGGNTGRTISLGTACVPKGSTIHSDRHVREREYRLRLNATHLPREPGVVDPEEENLHPLTFPPLLDLLVQLSPSSLSPSFSLFVLYHRHQIVE